MRLGGVRVHDDDPDHGNHDRGRRHERKRL
jgi:hypothetical protein